MIEQIQMIELINAKAFVDIRCIPVSLFSSLFIYFNFCFRFFGAALAAQHRLIIKLR